ncbi:MAG TPA: sulfatase [bacterium]|nr:sulfatase [bacterium]HPQ67284.1 sulfatase [bacterium]
MKKIAATAVILAAAAAAAALLLKRERRPPDVLLISIDSLRADHLSCYGYGRNTSPHLDELAEEGTLFAACAATTSWTLPSHISIFTGRDISAHQVVGDGFSLNDSVPTLPEALSAAGYATAAFCSSPYLNPAFGFGRGFDLYHNTDFDRHGSRDTILPSERERDAGHGDVTSERIVELAGDWLGEKRDRPFFLFLHFWDVHYDYIPPAPYDRLFDPDYRGPVTGRDYIHNPAVEEGMDPRDLFHIVALYDGEIAWTDRALGELFRVLKERGLWENTLIVVTADHGDEFFEHGGKGHRASLYDEVVHVPLLVKLPGEAPRTDRVEVQTALVDIAPTVLEAAGLAPWAGIQGRSLLPLIRGEAEERDRTALLELLPALQALRTPEWKLLYNRERGETAVLDLRRDPAETHRFLVTGPERRRAEALFRRRLAADLALAPGAGSRVDLSEREMEKLRALGYLSAPRPPASPGTSPEP